MVCILLGCELPIVPCRAGDQYQVIGAVRYMHGQKSRDFLGDIEETSNKLEEISSFVSLGSESIIECLDDLSSMQKLAVIWKAVLNTGRSGKAEMW